MTQRLLRLPVIFVVALMFASCEHAPAERAADNEKFPTDYSDGFDQSDAIAVLHNCHAPTGVLWVEQNGDISFEPPLDMDYESSVCILDELKASGTTKFGFVGNEKYVTPESE